MGAIQNDLDPDTYIGLELPLTYGNSGFFTRTKTALEQTRSNIKNLLSTNKGERLGNPTFGCDLNRLLFEKEGDIESDIEEEITSAINEFLPFVRSMWPEFIAGRHHHLIAEKMEQIASGKLKRLIINTIL